MEASTLSAVTATRGDEELLAAWRAGDRRAGELLFERYYEPVARFFLNKTDAQAELIQQTFLACVEGAPKFRGEGSFRSFLFAIAEGTVKSRLRRGRALLREAIAALANNPALAGSTLLGIESWAAALRARVGRQACEPKS